MKLDPAETERLRATHGDVVALLYQDEEIALRKCTPGEYKRFRASSFNEKKRDIAIEQLVRDTIVYPARSEIDGLFEKYPALAEAVGAEALKLAGLVDVEIRKS